MRYLFILCSMALLAACAETQTRQEAFPKMYGDLQPSTILVVPAINLTTAADAGQVLNVTVAQPFADHGYYVIPMPIVQDIFQREGVIVGEQVRQIPAAVFRDSFGADAVLFMTIKEWDKNYIVIAADVTVSIEYELVNTTTGETLWNYDEKVVVNTSGNSGSIIADLIATAITTSMTEYADVAYRVHNTALTAMPVGGYHPDHRQDGEVRAVLTNKTKITIDTEE